MFGIYVLEVCEQGQGGINVNSCYLYLKALHCLSLPLASTHFFFLLWQITVMIVTGVLVGFNLYGAIMLRQYFDQVWFLPPNSMGYKYTVTNAKVSLTPVLLLFLVI